MSLDDDFVVLTFPKVRDQIAELKRIPGARWDSTGRTWRVPVAQLAAVRAFAVKHDFTIDPAVARFALPDDSVDIGVASHPQGAELTFAYDPVLVRAIKTIDGAKFSPKTRTWIVPTDQVPDAVAFARSFGLPIADDLVAAADAEAQRRADLAEASRAHDADILLPISGDDLLPFQRAGVAYALQARRCFIADEMGLGKGGCDSTKILTPTGWITFADVTVGDRVIGSDGTACRVTGVYPRGVLDVYRVEMSDGSSVICDADHLWAVQTAAARHHDDTYDVRTTAEIGASLTTPSGNAVHFIPLVRPVQFDDVHARPIDPYLLGVLLGDGHFATTPSFSTADDDLAHLVATRLPDNVRLIERTQRGNVRTIAFVGTERRTAPNPLTVALRALGLDGTRSATKFIPDAYLFAPPDVRLAILRGLLDTDGHAGAHHVEFVTVSARLADGVEFLVRSLGGITTRRTKQPWYTDRHGERRAGKVAHRLSVVMPPDQCPFLLTRKAERWQPAWKYPPRRSIRSITPVGRERVTCIAVDAPDRLYVTDEFIVTHNTAQALVTLEAADAFPAVVACPSTLVLNWAKEAARWTPGRTVQVITDRKAAPIDTPADLTVVGWANLSFWHEHLVAPQAFVCDESHYAKNPAAQRTKAAVTLARTVPDDGIVLCLTGTPITNRPAEFAPQLDILGHLGELGGRWGFYRRFCGAFRDRFGHWHIDGASNLNELHERLRQKCYIRRTKADVLAELPPITHDPVVVTTDSKLMREYAKAEADIARYVAERARQIAIELGENPRSAAVRARLAAEANEHLVRISALRRIAALAKMPAIVEWVETRVESGAKVVLAAHHRDVVDALADRFGGLKIQGGMSVEDVERHKAAFQEQSVTDAPVIVLSIQAAKTGHTLTAAHDVGFVELPWTPADVDQTIARVYGRLSDLHGATATYLLADGTIDETIFRLIGQKREVVDAVTDGTGGGGADGSVETAVVGHYLTLGLDDT
jgi:hypothetical protein